MAVLIGIGTEDVGSDDNANDDNSSSWTHEENDDNDPIEIEETITEKLLKKHTSKQNLSGFPRGVID